MALFPQTISDNEQSCACDAVFLFIVILLTFNAYKDFCRNNAALNATITVEADINTAATAGWSMMP